MIRKKLKLLSNYYCCIEWYKKNKKISKNDLPAHYTLNTIYLRTTHIAIQWRQSYLKRDNDLPSSIKIYPDTISHIIKNLKFHTINYKNVKYEYLYKIHKHKYKGAAYIKFNYLSGETYKKTYKYKFINGICIKRLAKQILKK